MDMTVMAQPIDGDEHPVWFIWAGKFTLTEQKFSATERERVGTIFAIRKLRFSKQFSIENDHNPLFWL